MSKRLKHFKTAGLSMMLGGLAFTVISCQNPQEGQTSSPQIVGGQPATFSDPGYSSAVGIAKLLNFDGNSLSYESCTGTLVASNLIVTAAHCLEDVSSTTQLYLVFGNHIEQAEQMIERNTRTNPVVAFDFNRSNAETHRDDIGWIKFSGSIPSHYKPIGVYTGSIESIQKGTNISLAGFGKTGEDLDGGQLLSTRTSYRRYYDYGQGEGYFSTEGNGSVCHGDSGGPAYIQSGGAWYVLGATTGPNWVEYGTNPSPTCERRTGLFTHISRHLSWIQSTSGVRVNTSGTIVNPNPIDPFPNPNPIDPFPDPDPLDPFPNPIPNPVTSDIVKEYNIQQQIPDRSSAGAQIYFSVMESRTITSASVTLNILHPEAGEIGISATHPDGTTIYLKEVDFAPGANVYQTFVMSAFVGKRTNGNWTIKVTDNSRGNIGNVVSTRLHLKTR